MMNMIIRRETENDYRTVEELTREAFWNLYVPGCTEHFVLHNLRKSRDFIPELDFIAEKEGQIVGNIVYSRGIIRDAQGAEHTVLCFGPVSVLPEVSKTRNRERFNYSYHQSGKDYGLSGYFYLWRPQIL